MFIMVLLLSGVFAFAQSDDEDQPKRVDFYGYVVTADSLKPIRNTHVISKMADVLLPLMKSSPVPTPLSSVSIPRPSPCAR